MRPPGLRAACVLLPPVLFILLASFHARDAFTNDETWEFYASKTLLEEGKPLTVVGQTNALHPHGYYYLVSWAFGLFGVGEVAARGVGIAAAVLCYFVLLRMVRVLGNRPDEDLRPRTCLLVGLFYLLSPAVVQGSLVITADPGIHQLVILVFLLYFVERYPFAPVDLAVLPLLFALTLWVKVVTPCLMMATIVVWFLWKRRWRDAIRIGAAAGAGGLLLFFGFWTLHCRSLEADPLAIFGYLWRILSSRKVESGPAVSLFNAGRSSVVLLIWLGIPYALLMLRSLLRSRRPGGVGSRPMVHLLLAIGTVLLLVHALVSGVGYGFPRYHFTVLPIWAVLVTLHVEEMAGEARLDLLRWAPAAGAAAVWLLLAGDPLHALNFDLKASLAGIPGLPVTPVAWICLKLCLLLARLAAGLVLWSRSRTAPRAAAILAALTAAHSLSLDALQARADYATHYCYGEEGTPEMLAHCAARLEEGKKVLSCMDVVYHLVDRDYVEDWYWNEKDFLLARLSERENQLVVMGLTHNTLSQLRRMAGDEEIKGILERSYSRRRIGSYLIWERTKGDPRLAARTDGHGRAR